MTTLLTARPTALVVVDMQTIFVEEVGSRGARVVAEVNALVVAAADAGVPVVYTVDVDPAEGVAGTAAADLHPDLIVRGPLVRKGPGTREAYSGFVLALADAPLGDGRLSALAAHLRAEAVEHLVVVGLAGDVCVSATAIDARRLGYAVTLPLRATAFVGAHPGGAEGALELLRGAGVSIDEDPPKARSRASCG